MPGSPLPSPVSAAQDKSPPFSTAAVKSTKRWKEEGEMGGLPAGDELKNEAALGVCNGAAMSHAKQKETSASFKDTAEAISQPSKAMKVSENEMKLSPPSSLPSSVSATQDKSPPFSTAVVKSRKGEGEMGGLPAGDDESEKGATMGSSNGAAMRPAKQKENSASEPSKAKKGSKNERKIKLSKDERKALRTPQAQEGANGDPVNLLDAAAISTGNYGNVPLELFQTFPKSPRLWTEVSELVPDTVGRMVLIRGWAQSIRSIGKKITFMILRDGLKTVQCVLFGGAEDMVRFVRALSKESSVEVQGFVTLPDNPPSTTQQYHKETLKLRYAEGIEMLKDSGFEIEHYDDLSTRAEKRLGQLVREKYNTDFFILYEFPLAVRPFYTMPCFESREYSNSYDAFIRGEEVVSGSQRIHSHGLLLQRINECGLDLSTLKDFTDSFLHGAPPRGGFGAGLERLVMLYCGLPNIRQASLFPRDP